MQVVVIADNTAQKEFEEKGMAGDGRVHFAMSISEISADTDVLFYLLSEDELQNDLTGIGNLNCVVFVNAVITTSGKLPDNCIRINAWPGFLQRSVIEMYSSTNNMAAATKTLDHLGWKCQLVPDIAGMIAARIIAMIINEAYFALGDEVSSKEDIDTAMKLGTNYPFGPFEWGEKIGLKNICGLLQQLALTNVKYAPADALVRSL